MSSEHSFPERYPATRLRRTRATDWSRRLVREHSVTVNDLIWPIFVIEGKQLRQPIAALPDVHRLSVDLAVEAAQEAESLGIPVIALFPAVAAELKTPGGEEALNPDNLICRAVRAIRSACPKLGVMCDVALDPYTSHGHDGLLRDGMILNDETVDVLIQQALVQAATSSRHPI